MKAEKHMEMDDEKAIKALTQLHTEPPYCLLNRMHVRY